MAPIAVDSSGKYICYGAGQGFLVKIPVCRNSIPQTCSPYGDNIVGIFTSTFSRKAGTFSSITYGNVSVVNGVVTRFLKATYTKGDTCGDFTSRTDLNIQCGSVNSQQLSKSNLGCLYTITITTTDPTICAFLLPGILTKFI